MLKLISPFDVGNFIDKKGFDVFPLKQENNMYKCVVFQGEKSLGIGKYEYKDWQEAVNKTNMIIYDKLVY